MTLAAVDLAARQVGLSENDKAKLGDFLSNGGQNLDPATTAWCAAFVNSALNQSGVEGTNSLSARSYLDWGQPVEQPQRGDVAVFSRGDPNGWQGHVGFYDGVNADGTYRIIGGNQGDKVSIANYGRENLLGFRRAEDQQNALAGAAQGQQMPQQPQNALAPMQMPQAPLLDPAAFMSRRKFV